MASFGRILCLGLVSLWALATVGISTVLLPKCGHLSPGRNECPSGSCCSIHGHCGTTADHCGGSQCQHRYSDSCDTFFGPSGPDTTWEGRILVGNVPYGIPIHRCEIPGTMALTFNDGPSNYTEQLLDVLDELKVKATFFITGNNLGNGHIDDPLTPWPRILRRMHDSGHQLASHTWTHRDLDELVAVEHSDTIVRGAKIRETEIMFNEKAFRNLFGWVPTYMRPPKLKCKFESGCQKVMRKWGYHLIYTNLNTKDHRYDDPKKARRARKRFGKKLSWESHTKSYIPLAHDIYLQTVANLTEYMVSAATERGYKLVTVGECLNDPKENWYRPVTHFEIPNETTTQSPASTATETARRKDPSKLTKYLIPSEDGHCGKNTSYTCSDSKFGSCCSHYGFCGSGPLYCGTGCDDQAGVCYPISGEIPDTTNGLCGPLLNATCLHYGNLRCCSRYSFCGNHTESCDYGCQSKYGECYPESI